MAGARVFTPACRVTITTQRGTVIDVSPLLGDNGHVTTAKALDAPKGTWQISVPDQPFKLTPTAVADSLYGQVAPMDVIEIRLARNAYAYPDKQPPVVMRGFVRSVTRSESMGEDGTPSRMVTLAGDDYGCIGEIAQLTLLAGGGYGQDLLPILWPADFGMGDFTYLSAPAYIWVFVDKLMNDLLKKMQAASPAVKLLKYDPSVTKGEVYISRMTETEGTAWKMMFDQADTPWNELYVEDREDGPWVVYRPTPWKDRDGKFITNTGQTINAGKIAKVAPDADASTPVPEFRMVRSATYQRTDAQVKNVYWVTTRASFISEQAKLGLALAQQWPDVHRLNDPNCAGDRYGPRILTLETTQVPAGATAQATTGRGEASSNANSLEEWAALRRQWLIAANTDNVLRDQGSLVVRGNEKLKIGAYYQIQRGQLVCDHYITEVSHTFVPGHEFFTQVQFIRSTNYDQRDKLAKKGQSPFWAEGRQGVMES
jgi:hypothetical protein